MRSFCGLCVRGEEGSGSGFRISREYWILEAAIPFRNFAGAAKHTPPVPGDVWRLGLNRCGGKTNPQYSQWSASRTKEPQFHSPNDFGRVIFSEAASPFWRR